MFWNVFEVDGCEFELCSGCFVDYDMLIIYYVGFGVNVNMMMWLCLYDGCEWCLLVGFVDGFIVEFGELLMMLQIWLYVGQVFDIEIVLCWLMVVDFVYLCWCVGGYEVFLCVDFYLCLWGWFVLCIIVSWLQICGFQIF